MGSKRNVGKDNEVIKVPNEAKIQRPCNICKKEFWGGRFSRFCCYCKKDRSLDIFLMEDYKTRL